MSVKVGVERLDSLLKLGEIPVHLEGVLGDLRDDLDDFITLVNDYDEWESMRETATHDENGTHYSSEPGFSLVKLRKMLGFDERGK